MDESTEIEQLRAEAGRLVGATVERVAVRPGGEGAFGLLLGGVPMRGWLTVFSPAWRLDQVAAGAAAVVVAASGDREQRLAEDLTVLVGREVTALDVRLPGWDTRIRFGEFELTVFPLRHRDPAAVPDWTFRVPSGRLLAVGPGPRLRVAA
ncbi:hypothetical protein ABT095_09460 [Kitasatospora sp. NPDC002227]|uniref:hypothetical protein n=1 Tax=Kitasatospora sp. NPDC002227 TaxID=3154773 RepID=UPI00332988C8